MKIKTIIIDDDFYAIETAKTLIKNNNLDISIIGEAGSVVSGIKIINQKKPDLVLLDIELPDGTAFDLLDCFPEYDFNVIFVTAFNHYVIKAFKFSALAFIQKPIDAEELIEAVQIIKDKKMEADSYKNLLYNIKSEKPHKLEIRASEGIYYIDINEIIHLDSDGRYSTIYISDEKKIVVAKTLGYYEDVLSDQGFVRIHNSHIINLNHVKKMLHKDGGQIRMSNGSNLTISRNKKDIFQQEMKKYIY